MEKDNHKIKIKYLYHSGFLVETANHLLVFDYYQGSLKENITESSKKIFIFSSHSHPDHFNPEIFEWQKLRSGIHYILSHEIKVSEKIKNAHFLSPYDELELDDLKIKAYNSTDLGVSFLVEADGLRLFHAGDLNWWYWWDDTPEEMMAAETNFKDEIQKIKGQPIDIAFFPVDPRLKQNYSQGAVYFIQEIKPDYFVPMHFSDQPEIVHEFRNKMNHSVSKIIELIQREQELTFSAF